MSDDSIKRECARWHLWALGHVEASPGQEHPREMTADEMRADIDRQLDELRASLRATIRPHFKRL